MSMTVEQLVTEIRSLPHDVVADLVDRVLFESHDGQEPGHTKAWSATAIAASTRSAAAPWQAFRVK